MPAAAAPITAEEFSRLPESEAYILELRNGEVVQFFRPKKRHDDRVYRIRRWLQPFADQAGYLDKEFTYRPLPEYEVRVADLAFVSWDRWHSVADDDYLRGAPEFVVEVASPSNSAEELQEKKELCLANGCREFWVVYPKLKQVDVFTQQASRTYRMGDAIAMTVFPGHEIGVNEIFAPVLPA